MRLTYKLEEPIETIYLHYDYMRIADYDISRGNYGRITYAEIYNKLGQYEDNDEKLGIDYNTITKALLKGVYYIELGGKAIKHTCGLSLRVFDGKRFCLENKQHCFTMETYGKKKFNGWALTKEELL